MYTHGIGAIPARSIVDGEGGVGEKGQVSFAHLGVVGFGSGMVGGSGSTAEQRRQGSSFKSGELWPPRLGLTASLEVEEVVTGFGRGNAVAEEVRPRGTGHRRQWRRRRSRRGSVLTRGASSGGLYRRGRERGGEFTSPGRKYAAGEGRSRPAGERAALAAGGVSWRRESGSGPHVRARRGQGAGQVALEGSLGSTWPQTRRGRSPPAAYGRAAAKERGEGGARTRL